jgi:hypothetical protein
MIDFHATWSPAGYSSIGVFASRARLCFTGTRSLGRTLQSPEAKGTFLFCREGDISILLDTPQGDPCTLHTNAVGFPVHYEPTGNLGPGIRALYRLQYAVS